MYDMLSLAREMIDLETIWQDACASSDTLRLEDWDPSEYDIVVGFAPTGELRVTPRRCRYAITEPQTSVERAMKFLLVAAAMDLDAQIHVETPTQYVDEWPAYRKG